MMADREKTHHLFKNTNTTVLAMFKSIQAPSTILDRSPFFADGPLLLCNSRVSPFKSLLLLISISSPGSSKEGITNRGLKLVSLSQSRVNYLQRREAISLRSARWNTDWFVLHHLLNPARAPLSRIPLKTLFSQNIGIKVDRTYLQ